MTAIPEIDLDECTTWVRSSNAFGELYALHLHEHGECQGVACVLQRSPIPPHPWCIVYWPMRRRWYRLWRARQETALYQVDKELIEDVKEVAKDVLSGETSVVVHVTALNIVGRRMFDN